MTISVPRRVHIAPQGFEDERIHLPAAKLDADLVILVSHENESQTGTDCSQRIQESLVAEGIKHEKTTCDLFDLTDALETILETIRSRKPDDNIDVNISAGSKITAIAGMLACMITGADPYYVVPEGYHKTDEDDDQATVSYGMKDIKSLPAYPVTAPDSQLIEVLAFIREEQPEQGPYGVLLKEIGRYLIDHDLPAVQGSQTEEAEKIYPIVNERIVDPLRQHGLVSKTRLDGGTQIRTTQDGEEMLSLAESLLGERPDS